MKKGVTVFVSHDGNEGGFFTDVTAKFPIIFKNKIKNLAAQLKAPVIGVDVIIDSKKRMWFVDVNTNPAIDFFGDALSPAYQTIDHLVSIVSARTYKLSRFG